MLVSSWFFENRETLIFKNIKFGTLKENRDNLIVGWLFDNILKRYIGRSYNLNGWIDFSCQILFILDIVNHDDASNKNSIILGMTFLKTAKAKINGFNGTLSMKIDDEVINFNIHDALWYPTNISYVNCFEAIEHLTRIALNCLTPILQALVLDRILSDESTK